jgi:pimeloyl-ACP methyl ester carboxylesterase
VSGPATAVFVHGGWHDSWSWHLVRALLDARGVPSVALDLPMRTLAEDAGVLRAALADTAGPAVVVAHSWGGSVATLGAAGPPGAAHLIYIAATLTDIGHPVGGPVSATGRPTMRSAIVIDAGDATVIDPEACREVFYPDVPEDLARQAAARLRPFAKTGYDIVPTDLLPAWKTTPVTYAVCTQDRMIHPDTQRDMAAAAGAAVVEWPSGHSPFLSRPDLVADLVAARAREVSA